MKFIHFGCWNNGECNIETGTNGLSMTMKKINQYLGLHRDINFMTIAGDNYYPEKIKLEPTKKIKKMNIKNLISGINCLPKEIQKYVLLGNHEYDSIIDDNGEEIKCISLMTQQNLFTKMTNTMFFNDIIHLIHNNTLIIMIDTTIYEFLQNEKYQTKKPNELCYDKVFIGKTFDELNSIATYQKEKVREIILSNSSINNIILIGHHPIFSVKKQKENKISKPDHTIYKSDHTIYKKEVLPGLVDLYKHINDIIIGKNIYHLCADTHLYQTGTIKINNLTIHQYIIGTGGADPDDYPIALDEYKEDGIIYNINRGEKIFGFLVVDISDSPIFEFIYSNDTTALTGGYYYKYLKYKNKYMELKNNQFIKK